MLINNCKTCSKGVQKYSTIHRYFHSQCILYFAKFVLSYSQHQVSPEKVGPVLRFSGGASWIKTWVLSPYTMAGSIPASA